MIILILKSLVGIYYIKIREFLSLCRLQKKYPTCKFYSGSKVTNSIFGDYNVIFNNVIIDECEIGNHSYIQKNSTIFNAKIGKFCSIASGVSIGPGIHKIDGVSTHPVFYLKNTPLVRLFSDNDSFASSKQTVVNNDVWIGEGAILIDGISIGTGAIIAAGSVVTKDVEPYSIVGGLPAKHIKYRFEEKERNSLLKSEWWNFSEKWLIDNYRSFADTSDFLYKINK